MEKDIIPKTQKSLVGEEHIPHFPRWAREDYNGKVDDFLMWMTAAQLESPMLHDIVMGLAEEATTEQMVALAKQQALEKLSELPDLAEGAMLAAIEQGIRERWFEDLPVPLDSMEEVFMNLAEGYDEKTSSWYDMMFIAETVIPAMEHLDIESNVIWQLPKARSKLRAAVPSLKERIPGKHRGSPDVFTTEAQQEVKEILHKVVDDNIATRELRKDLQRQRGTLREDPQPPNVEEYQLPKGTWFIVRCDNPSQREFARRYLNKIKTADMKDISILARELASIITGMDYSLVMPETDLDYIESEFLEDE